MFNYIHRIDGSTVNEVLINNQAFTEVGGGKYNITELRTMTHACMHARTPHTLTHTHTRTHIHTHTHATYKVRLQNLI